MKSFLAELKRRNVYKVAVAYLVVGWLVVQVATQVFPFFDIGNWVVRLVVLLLLVGFPVAVVGSWAFELTPEGIKREREVESHGQPRPLERGAVRQNLATRIPRKCCRCRSVRGLHKIN